MRFDNKEDLIQWTPLWQGERFENGRPKVSTDILGRMERVTTEQAWGVLWRHGYKYQFEGNWKIMHPDRILVGRAVTTTMVPMRPDLHECLLEYGHKEEGRIGFFNSWVIETLQEDDVLVVDMFGKVYEGTFCGGNLSTAVATRTKRGQILDCGIRDVQQIMEIPRFQTFYRGNDPTPIRNVTLTGINIPCRIGNAICMPGDVVLGTPAGVLFIPPHLAEECVVEAEKVLVRDLFGLQRIREGVYTSAQMDTQWTPEIRADFAEWRKTSMPDAFRHLQWDDEPQEKSSQKGQKDEPTLL